MGIALATYYLKIMDNDKKEYVYLDQLGIQSHLFTSKDYSQYKDSYFCFNQCLNDLKESGKKHESKKKRIKVDHVKDNERLISGLVLAGNLGAEQTAMGPEDSDDTIINHDTAVGPPYYFLMFLPEKSIEGIVILERRERAIKEIFQFLLNQAFKDLKIGSFSVELNQFVPQKILEEYVSEGVINKITYVSYIKNDSTDLVYEGLQGQKGEINLQYKFMDKPLVRDKLRTLLLGLRKLTKKEMNIRGNPYDDMKIELGVGNGEQKKHKRTFTISNPENSYPYYDLTEDDIKMEKGNPVFESIDDYAKDYLKRVLKS
ncbi:MAG: hypothetical protein U1C19_07835 [Methanobacteriaceae archaeon]|nr:hypothetical protein [Methanobacteriaceae archaeon]